jgi:hypothetical protein
MSELLAALAARASAERPYFLGYRLRHVAEANGWSDADLARQLGCTTEALTMIRLCRAPGDGAAGVAAARKRNPRQGGECGASVRM